MFQVFGAMLVALVLALGTAMLPAGALAQKRVALVIGNSAYQHTPKLANPKNDASDMAAALKKHGFVVIEGFDLDKGTFDLKVHEFATALRGAAAGVLFYAGHGMQVSGRNYLVPISARADAEELLDLEMVRVDVIQRVMELTAKVNVLFLDACRDNPLARNLARNMGTRSTTVGTGLSSVEAGEGTLISFSTHPGAVASDGTGRNSPYTSALVKHITSATDELSAILIAVRNDVMKETQRKQVPWEHSALTARFYFATKPVDRIGQPPRIDTTATTYEQQAELAFWSSVKDAKDPQILQMYLNKFPSGTFAELAKLMIAQLKREAEQLRLQIDHEEDARKAQIAKQEAEALRIEAEQKARAAEAAKQRDELHRALLEAKKAQEALRAAELERQEAVRAAEEAKRLAETLKSEREAQTEAARQWSGVKDTNDHLVLEGFIRQFGQTIYGATARARLDELKRQKKSLAVESGVNKAQEDNLQKKVEQEAQAKAEDLVRQRLAALQAQQEKEKGLAALKRVQQVPLKAGAVRAKLSSATVLRALALSPNEKELAVAADDGVIRIVDLATFRVIKHLSEQFDGVSTKTLAYSGDGSLLVAGKFNGKIEIWDTRQGTRLYELKSGSSKVFAVAYYLPELNRYAVSGGSEGMEIWNMARKTIASRPALHAGAVRALAYSFEKSGIFVSGGEDGQLVFYLPGNRQKPILAHRGGVFAAAFALDNSIVVTGGADGVVKVWNAKNQSEQLSLQGHSRYVLTVALSKNAYFVASGGGDKSVRLWSVENGKLLHALEGHERDVEAIVVLGDGKTVISVSEDRTLRVWDGSHGRQLLTSVFYSDGEYIAYDQKGRFVGTPSAAARLEIGTEGEPRGLSQTELTDLLAVGGLGLVAQQ